MKTKYNVVYSLRNLQKLWLNEPNAPAATSIIDSFHSLKKAIKWMEQMDMCSMVLPLAIKYKLPFYMQKLGVTTDKGDIIAIKQYMPQDKHSEYPAGIYMIVDKQGMSLADFEKKTGLYLPEARNLHGDGNTFLQVREQNLYHQQQQELRKHLFSRIIRPDGGKGLTMN